MTYTARTDFETIQISKVPPIPSRGASAMDPDFNTPILRVTDPAFNPLKPGEAYFAGVGGSASKNVWNRQSTKFCFEDQGDRVFLMGFDPANFKTYPLFPSSFKEGTFCLEKGGRGVFSSAHDVYFAFDGLTISQYDFSKPSINPPTPSIVCDFSSALPGFDVTWQSIGGVSRDGRTFAIALSNSGPQGTGTTIMVYRAGKGWRRFDTETGLVTGQWGKQGTIQSFDRFTIHNIDLSPSGKYLVIATAVVSGNSIKNKHFWNLDTLEMSVVSTFTDGHWASGYSHWLNQAGVPFGQCQTRLFSAPGSPSDLISPMPPTRLVPVLDSHLSWNNVDPADTAPFFLTTTSPHNPYPGPWYNEILGVSFGKVYRFCHTMNSGDPKALFSIMNAIGCVDQQAKFMLFCSDWMKQTRGDVFIVPLR